MRPRRRAVVRNRADVCRRSAGDTRHVETQYIASLHVACLLFPIPLYPQLTARVHPAILCASQSARGAAVYPQIYLGNIPTTSQQRRALRALALDIRARIHATRAT